MSGETIGEDLRKLKENLRIEIKALLCSSKAGLTERELKIEYRNQNGRELPYAQIGYKSLDELMRDMPNDVQIVKDHHGIWLYLAIHDEKTLGLACLVRGQTDKNKKVREEKRQKEARFRSASYNGYRQPWMTSVYRQPLPPNIQSQIEDVLRANNCRMRVRNFEYKYVQKFGFMINFTSFGFSSLRELLDSLNHLVVCESDKPDPNDFAISMVFTQYKFANNNQDIPASQNKNNNNNVNNDNNNANKIEITSSDNANKIEKNSRDEVNNSKINTDNNNNKSTSDSGTVEIKQPTTKKALTIEDEMVLNLVSLVEKTGEEGIKMCSVWQTYKNVYQVPLDFEKLGYVCLEDLLYVKLGKLVQFNRSNENQEPKMFGKHVKIPDEEENLTTEKVKLSLRMRRTQENKESKMEKLRRHITNVFKQIPVTKQTKPKISVAEFQVMFESTNGWKLNPEIYGFNHLDQMFIQLQKEELVEYDFDDEKGMKIGLFVKEVVKEEKVESTLPHNDNDDDAKSTSSSQSVIIFFLFCLNDLFFTRIPIIQNFKFC